MNCKSLTRLETVLVPLQERWRGLVPVAVLRKRELLKLLRFLVELKFGREVKVLEEPPVIFAALGARHLLGIRIEHFEPTLDVRNILLRERLGEVGCIWDTRWVRRRLRSEWRSQFSALQLLPVQGREEREILHKNGKGK